MKQLLILILFIGTAFGQTSGIGQFGCNGAPVTGTAWTSATSQGTAQAILTNSPAWGAVVQFDQTTTLTGGAIAFQENRDGTNWTNVPTNRLLDMTTFKQQFNPYSTQPNTNQSFLVQTNGAVNLQIVLSSPIIGSGTVTPYFYPLCNAPIAPLNSLAPGAIAPNQNSQLPIVIFNGPGGSRQASPLINPTLNVKETAPAPSWESCLGQTRTSIPVSTNASAQLIAGQAGKVIRLCPGGVLVATTAGSASLVEGTGATCGTGTLAVVGATTAASGVPMGATSGWTVQGGRTAIPGNNLCLLLTGTGIIAGNLEFSFSNQ